MSATTYESTTGWPGYRNGRLGPFIVASGDIWAIAATGTNPTKQLAAYKSTDNGATFGSAVSTGVSISNVGGVVSFLDAQFDSANEIIYVVTTSGVYKFTVSSETWARADSGTFPTPNFDLSTATPGFLAVRSSTEFIFVYQGPTQSVMGTAYRRVYVSRYSGGAWQTAQNADGIGSVAAHADVRGAVIGSSSRVHVFYTKSTGGLFHRTYQSGNTFAAEQTAVGTVQETTSYPIGPVALAGTLVTLAYTDSSSLLRQLYGTSADSPTWSTASIQATAAETSFNGPGMLVYDGTTKYTVWNDDSGGDIYVETESAANTWANSSTLAESTSTRGLSSGWLVDDVIGYVFADSTGAVAFNFVGTFPGGGSTVTFDATPAGAASVSDVFVRTRAVAASPAGAASVTDAFVRTRVVAASPAGATTAAAILGRIRPLTASPAGAATATSTLGRILALTASSAGAGTATAGLARVKLLTTGLAGAATVTAAQVRTRGLSAAPNGAATVAAVMARTRLLAATASGAATATGALANTVKFNGSLAGVGAVTDALSVTRPFTASAAGAGTVTAVESPLRGFRATPAGAGTASASVVRTRSLTASAAGVSSVVDNFVRARSLIAGPAGVTHISVDFSTNGQQVFASAPSGAAVVAAALSPTHPFAASISAAGTVAASVRPTRLFAGSVPMAATVSMDFTTGAQKDFASSPAGVAALSAAFNIPSRTFNAAMAGGAVVQSALVRTRNFVTTPHGTALVVAARSDNTFVLEGVPMLGIPLTINSAGTLTSTTTIGRYQATGIDDYDVVAIQVDRGTPGATPAISWTVQGSVDGTNWYDLAYVTTDATAASSKAAQTTTTQGQTVLFVDGLDKRRFTQVGINVTADTNVPFTAQLLVVENS